MKLQAQHTQAAFCEVTGTAYKHTLQAHHTGTSCAAQHSIQEQHTGKKYRHSRKDEHQLQDGTGFHVNKTTCPRFSSCYHNTECVMCSCFQLNHNPRMLTSVMLDGWCLISCRLEKSACRLQYGSAADQVKNRSHRKKANSASHQLTVACSCARFQIGTSFP